MYVNKGPLCVYTSLALGLPLSAHQAAPPPPALGPLPLATEGISSPLSHRHMSMMSSPLSHCHRSMMSSLLSHWNRSMMSSPLSHWHRSMDVLPAVTHAQVNDVLPPPLLELVCGLRLFWAAGIRMAGHRRFIEQQQAGQAGRAMPQQGWGRGVHGTVGRGQGMAWHGR